VCPSYPTCCAAAQGCFRHVLNTVQALLAASLANRCTQCVTPSTPEAKSRQFCYVECLSPNLQKSVGLLSYNCEGLGGHCC
jgi:hypothetical protein